MTSRAPAGPASSTVEAALADAERKGFRLAVIGRTCALVAIAFFYLAAVPYPNNILRRRADLGGRRGRPRAARAGRRPLRAHRTLRFLRLRCGGHQRHAGARAAQQRRRRSAEPRLLLEPPRILLRHRGGLGPHAIAGARPLDRPLRRGRSRRRHGLDHGADGARRRPRGPAAARRRAKTISRSCSIPTSSASASA